MLRERSPAVQGKEVPVDASTAPEIVLTISCYHTSNKYE